MPPSSKTMNASSKPLCSLPIISTPKASQISCAERDLSHRGQAISGNMAQRHGYEIDQVAESNMNGECLHQSFIGNPFLPQITIFWFFCSLYKSKNSRKQSDTGWPWGLKPFRLSSTRRDFQQSNKDHGFIHVISWRSGLLLVGWIFINIKLLNIYVYIYIHIGKITWNRILETMVI